MSENATSLGFKTKRLGQALIDRALYLLKGWAKDIKQWKGEGVPEAGQVSDLDDACRSASLNEVASWVGS